MKPRSYASILPCLFLLTLAACTASGTAAETVSGDWIRVYFTDPDSPDGLDAELVSVIAQAERRVDVAAYDLNLDSVADALIAAHDDGIAVRLVTDASNGDEAAVDRIRLAGIPVVARPDEGWGIMHDKFVVVDDAWVWTGSWNLTLSGTFRNNNNAVLIASRALVGNYAAEFEEMFAGSFGASSPQNTANPHLRISYQTAEGVARQVEVENYFAPEDGGAAAIIDEIEDAQSRIRFMAFIFTSEPIADALIERSEAGVVVQGVIETRNADGEYSQYARLRQVIHDLQLDGNPYIMHHKVMIIDDSTVILGSFNFTSSADERNDENLLIIHDPEVAALFVEEFGRVYEEARTQ